MAKMTKAQTISTLAEKLGKSKKGLPR